jgi:fatty acid desaturase
MTTPIHQEVVSALPPELKASLNERRDLPGLARVAFHLGGIGALGLWIAGGAPFWFMALPVQGILIAFLFTLMHESVHGTAFKTSAINTVAAAVAGLAVLIAPSWFRYFHFAHHRHTHDPARDPELASAKPATRLEYVKHVSGIPVWIGNIRKLFSNALGHNADDYVPEKGRRRVAWEARVLLAVYALLAAISIALNTAMLVWIWIVPALLGQPFLRIYLLAEHTNCPHVDDMFENTRTTFTTGLVRFIAWNMPFHAEHHAMPTVPFHKLPALHRAVRNRLKVTANGYAEFNRALVAGLAPQKP